MITQIIEPDEKIKLIVKNILVFEDEADGETVLPFFADGYPGVIFHQTENGMWVRPQSKMMPSLFIYGQTIKPVELVLHGNYKVLMFQLYPFVLSSFYNLDARALNDNCYDMAEAENGNKLTRTLADFVDMQDKIDVLTEYLCHLFEEKQSELDLTIRKAIQIFLENKGKVLVRDIAQRLHITERTFERRFLKEVGISAKQFCQIVQFQQSFEQLVAREYSKLTDVVYSNGYADQSHFIRVFKAYTGSTPKKFAS